MEVFDLVDESAAAALQHAWNLQERLRDAEQTDASLGECRAEMHRLLGDIASLRNAAEILKRRCAVELPPAGAARMPVRGHGRRVDDVGHERVLEDQAAAAGG